jgi:hypothetical protein
MLIVAKAFLDAVETLLQSVYRKEGSSLEMRAEAAHYLTQHLLHNYNDMMSQAKSICEDAVQWKSSHPDRDETSFLTSVALLVHIYQHLGDPDEEIWLQLLSKAAKSSSYVTLKAVSPHNLTIPDNYGWSYRHDLTRPIWHSV